MRKQEFRDWLENKVTPSGGAMGNATLNFYIDAIGNIEKAEKINIDESFQKDGMASILKLYSYSAQDDRNKRPNPTNLKITRPAPYGALSDYKTALNHYRKFCLSASDTSIIEESPDNNNDTETIAEADAGTTFGLEKDLQDAIRENITQLESGLKIIDNGLERKVTSGFIDILAKDSQGRYVIIELKAGKAKDAVIAQILGYMGDIAQEENQPVRGIIVASDFNQRLRSASKAIPNLDLNSYSYTFDFKKET